jgi:hypothetical protein
MNVDERRAAVSHFNVLSQNYKPMEQTLHTNYREHF